MPSLINLDFLNQPAGIGMGSEGVFIFKCVCTILFCLMYSGE